MRKVFLTSALFGLVIVLLFTGPAFADTMAEPFEEQIVETVPDPLIQVPQDVEIIPDATSRIDPFQGGPVIAVDPDGPERIEERENEVPSVGNYSIKFIHKTDKGEKTCQFTGGSDEGIPVKEILNALQLLPLNNENTEIDVLEDSVDTAVIGVRRTDTGIYITDQGMFCKADQDLVILVDGEEISLSVCDDIPYLSPVYVEESDVTKGIKDWETKSVSATEVCSSTEPVIWGAEGESTWYAVTTTDAIVKLSKGVICQGNVNLILCNGADLEVEAEAESGNAGILVSGNNFLTIYAQNTGDDFGRITVFGGKNGAGIGGDISCNGNNITINGGVVMAYGGEKAAGIGSGLNGSAENIIINGGAVIANGGLKGAGIGGGEGGNAKGIVINGGNVIAYGGFGAAGIGGGADVSFADNIIINGGTVQATGGDLGPGIGAGLRGTATNIMAAKDLEVSAGNNDAEMEVISHNDHTDLSSYFSSKRCVQIKPMNESTPVPYGCPKVIKVGLNTLTTAQQEAIKEYLEKNQLTFINAFQVIKDGSNDNNDQEKTVFVIEPELFLGYVVEKIGIFQLNGDNTISQVSFTQENGKLAVKDRPLGLYFIAVRK